MTSQSQGAIFISYAHADKEWMLSFKKHLLSLEQEGLLSVWADPQISPGDDWFAAIKRAIDESCMAVLMVSPDFIASQFIRETEIPLLREAAEKRGLSINWFALRPTMVPQWLSGIQSLNLPESPVSDAVSKDHEFVKICTKIKRAFRSQVEPPAKRPAERPLSQPIRSFPAVYQEAGPCLMDASGQLWMMEGQQIKLFHVRQADACGREPLPNRPWKNHASKIWRQHVLLSDWSGAIYRFDGQHHTREKPLYEPKHDDLPVHRLAVGPSEHLFAAGWNGVIRRWEPDGRPSTEGWPIATPALPLHLAPSADGGLAVADQTGNVHNYSAPGCRQWVWRAEGNIRQMWSIHDEADPTALAIQLGPRRLVSLQEGKVAESIELASPICASAWRQLGGGGQWGAVACEAGRIEWLSLPGFARLDGIDCDFPIRQIEIVRNLQDDARLTAVGLTGDGCLFTFDNGQITRFDEPAGIRRLFVDPTGRFLYFVFDRKIEIYGNPVAPTIACRVEVVGPVAGKLKLNFFRKLGVRLKNAGLLPIHSVQGDVVATNDVDSHPISHSLSAPWEPGTSIDLDLSVRARAEGDLPLQLRIKLNDEGGAMTMFEQTLHVSSEN